MRRLVLDAYIVDTLMPDLVGHDRKPGAFLLYLFLWRQARARRSGHVTVSLREAAEGTGLSKRAVQSALAALVRRGLVSATRRSVTAVGSYRALRPWITPGRP